MKKCPFCQQEIQDEAVKCRYCAETLVHEPQPAIDAASLSFPNVWVGFVMAGLFLATEILMIVFRDAGVQVLFSLALMLISLAGLVYWCICLYKLHKILSVMAGGCYPITSGMAVGFSFIPFYNLYWIFKWPGEIIHFVRARSSLNTWAPWLPGVIFLGSLIARRIDGTLWLLIVFGVLYYLVRILKESVSAVPEAVPYKAKMASSVATTLAIVFACLIPVIGLLAAIAIPNLLRARLNANEGSVRADLRTFVSAAESFRASKNPPAYPVNLQDLVSPGEGPAYLDISWSPENQPKHGYRFFYASTPASFSVLATPETPNSSGINTYCIDQKGALVGSVNGAGAPAAGPDGCKGGSAVSLAT